MRLFSSKKERSASVQTCAASDRCGIPGLLNAGESLTQQSLYKSLRENVPVIDAAIGKLIRLLGDFSVSGADDTCTKEVNAFIGGVNVDGSGTGLKEFITRYFDQLLTYGAAVGEIVPYSAGKGIAAMYNAPLSAVELRTGDNPLDVRVFSRGFGVPREVERPELVSFTLLNPEPGSLKGRSVLSGLPFVSDLLIKILGSVGQNFERAGNVRFAVTYRPPAGTSSLNAKQRVEDIAREWRSAMRDSGRICDFVSVGDVSVKAIGADNQILDCDVPLRHILEQIVCKLSIPPFMLGFSWSTTERMSAQQADILTSEIEYYRGLLTPVIRWACSAHLSCKGLDPSVKVEWSNISLQDETELASARLDNARAQEIETNLRRNADEER